MPTIVATGMRSPRTQGIEGHEGGRGSLRSRALAPGDAVIASPRASEGVAIQRSWSCGGGPGSPRRPPGSSR
jgi:hypothetical protein